ncbi:YheT family hydrolase [Methylibium sp.]|uniref:YheT family hydrolase n=1 Tax=Methylibium sp. TaxID=2067992 RepID=UPI003D0E9431
MAAVVDRVFPAADGSAPWWLPSGNAQTIWPALFARRFDGAAPAFRRERWSAPDGDFIDVDFLADTAPGVPPRTAPLLVLFHGLEGSSASHYAQAFAGRARARGWHFALPHFRGCSGELNLAPRAYHSGDFEEIGWLLERLRAQHGRPVFAVGVSLGGNALLRWAEEAGDSAAATACAVCAISSPIDLTASGHAITRGFNRQVYNRMFLRTMKPKALAKLAQHPGLFDRARLLAARDLYEFDDVFTAPLHGFRNAEDYWARGSAKPHLERIRIPALVLNARNDPFVPAACLPQSHEVGRHVTLWQPAQGGHVGFPRGAFPGEVLSLPEAVMSWVQSMACV